MPPLWTARRILWTGVVVALGARLVVEPVLSVLASAVPFRLAVYNVGVFDLLGWVGAIVSMAVWVGTSRVAASFVVRVLEQRGVVPAAHNLRSDDRSNDL
jgi:hypothetical protein